MTGNRLSQIVELFQTPSSAEAAAQRVGWSRAILEGLLKQLQARGLLVPAEPGLGSCRSGCGLCSMQNFCPKSDLDPQEEPARLPVNPEVWRLTPLGEQFLEQQKHSAR